MEWKHGCEDSARRAFQRGGKCAKGSDSYSPLFQAWAQFEEAHGNAQQAAQLMKECYIAQSAEDARRTQARAAGAVSELMQTLDLGRYLDSDGHLHEQAQPV
jgi:hypothetical protein